MGDVHQLEQCERLLSSFVADFQPACWSGEDAAALVKRFARLERLATSGLTLAAGRAQRGNAWQKTGHRTAEEWLARETGTSLSKASDVLETAERVKQLPETEQAMRSGELSADQAAAVSSAGAADPTSERRMLADAATSSLGGLRKRSNNVRQSARPQTADERERIHRSRYFRHWRHPDGAVEGRFRLTPEAGAELLAAVAREHKGIFNAARQAGIREGVDAYEADALVAAATRPAADSGSGGPRALINVRVDRSALVRGHTEPGEVCEVDGIGAVSVDTVRDLASDAVLRALLVEGEQVIDSKAAGRTVTPAQRAALLERDRCCAVPGCDQIHHLEIHHLVPVRHLGPTTMDNLARICRWHHDLISNRGAELLGPYPDWRWCPPGSYPPSRPRDPDPPPDGVVTTLTPSLPGF